MSNTELPIDISVQDVAQLQRDEAEFLLLDVRGQDEYDTASIEGSVLIPMQELGQRLDELAGKEADHIVVHCHHGGRSLQVVQALRQRGFHRSQNMAGGIDQWSLEINDQVPRY